MLRRLWNPTPVADGRRLLMVCMELIMTLFALLYAFPHVPAALLEDVADGADDDAGITADAQWYSVVGTTAFRGAIDALLQTSQVLEASLRPGATPDDIRGQDIANMRTLSDLFDLKLTDPAVRIPLTCRQMYENVVALYRAVYTNEITTREELAALYQRLQLMPASYKLPGLVQLDNNRSNLIRFCSEMTVEWMQPYFARDPAFYTPQEVAAVACRSRA